MTIKECIDIVDDLKPNQYSTKVKVMWLSFIDEIIINDVLKTHKGYDGRYDGFTGYSEDKLSVPLIVESPYDRLYTAYLKMKIDGENGETTRYNNSAGLFNSYMMEYRKFYNKTHMPLSAAEREKSNCKATKLDVTEAQLEYLKRELYPILAEDINKAVSDDKIYDIVMDYVNNNAQMLKGKEGDKGDQGIQGLKGDTGAQGIQGVKGDKGDKGDKGEAFTYSDFTPDQLAGLKGEKGDPGEVTTAYANTTFANALKSSASGEALLLDDISPVEHIMGVEVSSKNLITYPYNIDTSTIPSGVTVTDNGDGSLTVNGSIMGVTGSSFATIATVTLEAGTYTLSCATDGEGTCLACTSVLGATFASSGYPQTFTLTETKSLPLQIYIPGCYTEGEVLTINSTLNTPQLELGATATAYTPYVSDLGNIVLRKQGKNLIPFPYRDLKLGTSTYNGVDFTVYEDGSILINGTATSSTTRYLYTNTTGLLGLKSGVTVSCNKNASNNTQQANVYFVCNYYDSAGKMQMGIQASTNASGTKTITDDWKGLGIYLNIPSGKTLNNLLIKPQLEIGTTVTEYEPYITPTEYTSNADGTVEGITSLYPNTTLTADTDGVTIDCEYNRDINKAFAELQAAIISLGGNV